MKILNIAPIADDEAHTVASASTTAAAGVGEVNLDAPAVELLLVEGSDRSLGLLGGAEGDEAEAAGATSLTVAHHNVLKRNNQSQRQGAHCRNAHPRFDQIARKPKMGNAHIRLQSKNRNGQH